ncbi:MAG TPA: C25 family cysteine peptidase, partial [Pyrinomonadaceae bacterium]
MKKSITALLFSAIITALSPAVFAQRATLQTIKKADVPLKKIDRPITNVVIATPEVFTDGTGAYITWHTESETNNLGFYVYRVNGKTRTQVGKFICGSALRFGTETVFGEEYSTFDPKGRPSNQYIVESIEQNGVKTESFVANTQIVDSLSSITGKTRAEMIDTALSTDPPNIVRNTDIAYSKDLLSDIRKNTPTPNLATQQWVASQPGVKIGVKQTGFYRVTSAQLQAAGFDINSDPTKWQLFVNGVEQAINLGPNASYIEFYGRGLDTLESATRSYFLVVGPTTGKRIATVNLRPALRTASATNYVQDALLKQRDTYIQTLLNGPTSNFYGDPVIHGATSLEEDFPLTSVDTTVPTARVIIKLLAFNAAQSRTISLALNGQQIGQVSNSGTQSFTFDAMVPTSALVSGQNAIQLTALNGTDATFFDSVEVFYNRSFVADQGAILFGLPNFYSTQVKGFSSPNIRMFDVSYDGTPVQVLGATVLQDGPNYKAIIPAYRERLMYGVEDSAILQPFSVTPNDPSTLSNANNNANLVIISYKDFITQANAWADYRRGQGFSVEVVNVEDVYDEFNYGTVSAQSLKDFLFYAKNNWQTPPQYVLLIGDTSYDPRDFEARGNINYMPSMMFDSLNEETASDDALVDFNNDGLAELAIGRIPAKTPDMVTNAFNKTVAFELNSTSQNLARGTL